MALIRALTANSGGGGANYEYTFVQTPTFPYRVPITKGCVVVAKQNYLYGTIACIEDGEVVQLINASGNGSATYDTTTHELVCTDPSGWGFSIFIFKES